MLLNQPRLTPPKQYNATSVTPAVVTSTTDVPLAGMSIVTPYAASWAIDFNSSIIFGSNGDQNWSSIYVGGVQVPYSQRTSGSASSNEGGMVTCAAVALNVPAGTTIEVRVRMNAAASGTFYERILKLIEVSP